MSGGARIGLEVLRGEDFERLRGKRLGVLTNPSGVDGEYRHILPIFREAGLDIARIFSPEHGLDAATPYLQAVGAGTSGGAAVVSLYGDSFESLRPPRESLADLDAVVFDIQDVGARYYTFVWTLAMAIEAAAETNTEVVVLDRPNPAGARHVEGGGLPEALRSFVGYREIPNRHGMTAGEIARMVAAQAGYDHLTVVAMEGYERAMSFAETGAPWVPPSPNIPRPETALLYPGQCLIEGTNLSEGRGTAIPFEVTGAPFIDGAALAEALNDAALPGVRFRAAAFLPTDDKWAGQRCGGVQIHVTDSDAYRPYATSLALVRECRRQSPDEMKWRTEEYEFRADVPAFDLLTGDPELRAMIDDQAELAAILDRVEATGSAARENRALGLIY